MISVNDFPLSALEAVGLPSVGPGIAGDRAWILTAAAVFLLAVLAWWTMRPARRATRAELRRGEHSDAAKTGQTTEPTDRARRSQ